MRVIDVEGKNVGVMPLERALALANEAGSDLVEVSAKASPPIAKVIEYGKYLYSLRKKDKGKGHRTETKSLQVKIATGEHDLELKSKKASEFLKEGHRVKIDLFLRGRAKYLDEKFLRERLERVLHLITEPYSIADGPTKSPKGLTIIIERGGGSAKNHEDKQINTKAAPDNQAG